MIVVKIDLEDGRGTIDAAISNPLDAERIRRFCIEASQRIRDAERWVAVEKRMTHERAGPHYGWCISEVMPGDSPAEAIDAIIDADIDDDYPPDGP